MEDQKVVVFQLKNEEYGVNVHQVRSIERMVNITRVPKTPPFIKGVMNLRGLILPVIDLRKRFNLEESSYSEDTRIIIVSANEIAVGLIVDAANDVIDVPANSVEPAPEVVGGIKASYLDGVAKLDSRLLVLLNLEKVLNPEEIIQLEQFGETLV